VDATLPGGRRALLEQLREDLEATRGLSLWGLPGVGKTRVARQLVPDAAVVDASALPGVEALRERVTSAAGPSLVVDGLDAPLERDEAGVQEVLASWVGADRRVVTTHRRRWTPPLTRAVEIAPLGEDDQMAIFVAEVARLHSPSQLDEDERAAMREVLPALDGLPRGILWAAARWGLVGTDGLVRRLREAPPDPTVREIRTIVDALPGRLRTTLTGLASFAGAFGPDDAERIVAAVDDVVADIGDLHRRPLLHRVAPGRFRVPRAVREVLPADPASRARHAAWCLERHREPVRERPGAPDVPDLTAAARWLVAQRDPRVGELLVVLATAAPGQHLELAESARDRVPTPEVHRALSSILRRQGRPEEATHELRQAIALAGDDARLAGPAWRGWGVLHQGRGDWAEARMGYERALTCAQEVGDARGVAIATANLGTIDHDRCAYEDAELRYAQALEELRAVDDAQVELTVRANQAVLLQELGKLDEAEPAYRKALVLLERARQAHTTAVTRGNLGLLLHEQGRLDEAEQQLREALETLAPIEDAKTAALCDVRLAAVLADRGEVDAADAAWEAATWGVQRADEVTQQVVELFGAFVDLAHDREAVARARFEAAEGVLQRSGDARIAARILRRRLSAAPAALRVDPDGFVPPGGERVDLSRHASIRRMFQTLLKTASDPSARLDVEALFAAGWPDERISPESMRNRVHVNLAKLRRWGLKTLIERTDGGYRLRATVIEG